MSCMQGVCLMVLEGKYKGRKRVKLGKLSKEVMS